MADIDTLRSLRDRVIAATGADRPLDYRLAWALDQEPWAGSLEEHIGLCMPRSKMDRDTRAYTASLDAAVALVERVLPGWDYDMWSSLKGEHKFTADLFDKRCVRGHGQTRPLALLAALLSALIARAEQEDAHVQP